VCAAIARLDGISNVILVGDGVHAVADDADLRIPALRQALESNDIPVTDIAVGEPSIEDVFVAVLDDTRTPR
jgi:hypothetical protein